MIAPRSQILFEVSGNRALGFAQRSEVVKLHLRALHRQCLRTVRSRCYLCQPNSIAHAT